MLERVTRAMGVSGGVMVALGLAYGLWKVGDNCGSAWSPNLSSGLGSDQTACALALNGRANVAWFFVMLGLVVLAAVVELSRTRTESTAPTAENPSAPGRVTDTQ
ncbi:hypothetical protein [Kitasatospora paranensis]|uniref:Uncharacterized protein n=1 Tax=Kitasatospora paranensis TaxID=258053 RepID=A0ABW2FQP7_9ACTN